MENKFFKLSISARLVASITLFVAMMQIIIGVYNYLDKKSEIIKKADKSAQLTSERLQLVLPSSLWNFQEEDVVAMVKAELESPYIYQIKVTSPEDESIFEKKNQHGVSGKAVLSLLTYVEQNDQNDVGKVVVTTDQQRIDQAVTEVFWSSLIQSLVIILCLIAIIHLVANYLVTKPLDKIITAVTDIAQGDGDLTKRIEITNNHKDEANILAKQINTFIEKTNSIIATIIKTASLLENNSSIVKKVVNDANEAFKCQYAELDQVATAITEMSASTCEITNTSQTSLDSALEAKKQAGEIGLAVNSSVSAVNELANDLESTSMAMGSLADTTNVMSSVVDVIKSVAEQTNLLALNAAIEAARAGDQGRGFAVVADEVRGLAGRTQQSTEEISKMIDQLQHDASSAVNVVSLSKNKGQTTTEMMNESVNSIQLIISASDKISDMSLQIATSVEQQAKVTTLLDENINQIVSSGQETIDLINQISERTDQLDEYAQQLSGLTSQFKV